MRVMHNRVPAYFMIVSRQEIKFTVLLIVSVLFLS